MASFVSAMVWQGWKKEEIEMVGRKQTLEDKEKNAKSEDQCK